MKYIICLICSLGLLGITKSVYSQNVKNMTAKTFRENIWDYKEEKEWKFKGEKPVILDFYASWCGPCRELSVVLKDIQKEYGESIQIYKINTDIQKTLAQMFDITTIPVMIFIPMEGNLRSVVGYYPKESIMHIIEEYLKVKPPQQ